MQFAAATFFAGWGCVVFALILYYAARPVDDLNITLEQRSPHPIALVLRIFRLGTIQAHSPWPPVRVQVARASLILASLLFLLSIWGMIAYIIGIK